MNVSTENGIIWLSHQSDVLRKPDQVPGYHKLSEDHQKLFTAFLNNFYRSWEFPEKHLPKKVKYIADKIPYLRINCEDGNWLHILSPTRWY
ncbi:MAG: hypothetical protein ABFC94_12695 [Syntrophomonas sp.]